MKLIKVSTANYRPLTLSPSEQKYYEDYAKCTFILRTQPNERLAIQLTNALANAGTVRRRDYVEYVMCDRNTFKKYSDLQVPVMCNIILIRKNLVVKNKRGSSLLTALGNILSTKGKRNETC